MIEIKEVIDNYFSNYEEYSVKNISSGNINNTYLLEITIDNANKKFLLQKINSEVFKEPRMVIENAIKILDYLKDSKIYYVKTLKGGIFYITEKGSYYRIMNYLENSISIENTSDRKIIFQAGKAFGNFSFSLKDFNCNDLYITLKNFHNTKLRFEIFENLENYSSIRFKRILTEWKKILALKNECIFLDSLILKKELPLRVVHNDTKCSNVLFSSQSLEYLTVIDFDTVMPGILAHDFGDGARSICSSRKEDFTNFEEVYFDVDKFYYFAKGYLSEVKDFLTPNEKRTIYRGVFTLTIELCIRFLTDYLQNDIYFKTDYEEHNLIRGLNQLALGLDVIKKEDQIKGIVNEFLN